MALLYLVILVLDAILLFGAVFFIIMFSDLECDYINPIDLCQKLNQFVVPDIVAHTIVSILLLLNGKWLDLVFNLPLLAYNVNKS